MRIFKRQVTHIFAVVTKCCTEKITFVWEVTPFGRVNVHRIFGQTCYLILLGIQVCTEVWG
jgi:hypothetical protein